jgi:hypothetical protein
VGNGRPLTDLQQFFALARLEPSARRVDQDASSRRAQEVLARPPWKDALFDQQEHRVVATSLYATEPGIIRVFRMYYSPWL